MCENTKHITQKTIYTEVRKSGIYNTVPLRHKKDCIGTDIEYQGTVSQKQSYIASYHKVYNIQLAKLLENSKAKDHKFIKNTAKALTCCSHLCKVEYYPTSHEGFNKECSSLVRTTAKCKNRNCPRCNSIKASKYKKRFLNCLSSDTTKHLFRGKYFYFLTFTVKHDLEGTRSEVYFEEFKKYVEQMRRSTLFKKLFPNENTRTGVKSNINRIVPLRPVESGIREVERTIVYGSSNLSNFEKSPLKLEVRESPTGYAQSYEVTFTPNGYHIHSHILMCSPPIRKKAKEVQALLSEKWLEITGDSYFVRFDLVKVDKDILEQVKQGEVPKKLSGFISECFKYTVKTGDIHKFNTIELPNGKTIEKIDLLTSWLIKTQSKKMLTSNGFFKGLQLFSTNKSIWDTEESEETSEKNLPNDPNARYFVGRTSQLRYNKKLTKSWTRKTREKVLDSIFITEIPKSFIEITRFVDTFDDYFNLSVDNEMAKDLPAWIEYCRDFEQKLILDQNYIDKITPIVLNRIGHKTDVPVFIQKNIFEDY